MSKEIKQMHKTAKLKSKSGRVIWRPINGTYIKSKHGLIGNDLEKANARKKELNENK